MQADAARKLAFNVGHHRLEHVLHRGVRRRLAEQLAIDVKQSPWILIGGASQHHAVDVVKMAPSLAEAGDAAIDDNRQFRQSGLQPIDPVVVERRTSRFSFGDSPLSQALRAWTISASAPAATTPRASASSAVSGS